MEQETMSTPDFVNLANQVAGTLDEAPKRKTAKINFQRWQFKVPKQNKNVLVSAVMANGQDIGQKMVIKCSRHL